MENTNELNLTNETEKKEQRLNINVRIKESLRDKIKAQMESDKKNPDEFFSDMFLAYLKDNSVNNGDIDYSKDLEELNMVIKRTTTIFQNIVEKNYMHNVALKESFDKEIEQLNINMSSEYEKKISKLEKDLAKTTKEYELIAEQAHGLIKDSKELKENLTLLKHANEKNEELLDTYKAQIESLKKENQQLELKLQNSIDSSLLDKLQIEHEKKLLEQDKKHQEHIVSIRKDYNDLQSKYISLIESKSAINTSDSH